MNDENLKGKGFDEITASEQRKIASMGGKKSAEVRRQRRDMKRAAEAILEEMFTVTDAKTKTKRSVSGAQALILKQFEKAMKGDSRAFEIIRDTSGQKPVEKVVVAEVDQSIIDEVEAAVMGEE